MKRLNAVLRRSYPLATTVAAIATFGGASALPAQTTDCADGEGQVCYHEYTCTEWNEETEQCDHHEDEYKYWVI